MTNKSLFRIVEKCCIANDEIWYVNVLLNGLFKVDIQTGKAFYIGTVDKEEIYLRKAYSGIVKYEEYLYMIPYNAAAIGIFHISTGKFDKIAIPETMAEKFCEAILLEDKIYLLPYKAGGFYCLDIRTRKLSKINKLKNIKISVASSVEKDGKIWFAEDGGHSLYCYEPIKEDLRCINLDKTKGCFSSLGEVENKIIVTAINKALALSFDLQTEEIAYFDFEEYSDVEGVRNYYIAKQEGKAFLVCTGSNDCIEINIRNGRIKKKYFLPSSLDMYGKIYKSELGMVMLPTIKDKAFRFLDGRTVFLDDKKAVLDWAQKNSFHWKECAPMPDFGVEMLVEMIGCKEIKNKERKEGFKKNIYEILKG